MTALVLLLALGLTTPTAHAQPREDAVQAEYHRLSTEMKRLAEKNAWPGVEATYAKMKELGAELTHEDYVTAAHAARALGDVGAARERLLAANELREEREVMDWLWAIDSSFGRVSLQADPGAMALEPESMPFQPDRAAAVRFAQQRITETGSFEGYLPEGTYTFGRFEVKVLPRVQTVRVDARGQTAEEEEPEEATLSRREQRRLEKARIAAAEAEAAAVAAAEEEARRREEAEAAAVAAAEERAAEEAAALAAAEETAEETAALAAAEEEAARRAAAEEAARRAAEEEAAAVAAAEEEARRAAEEEAALAAAEEEAARRAAEEASAVAELEEEEVETPIEPVAVEPEEDLAVAAVDPDAIATPDPEPRPIRGGQPGLLAVFIGIGNNYGGITTLSDGLHPGGGAQVVLRPGPGVFGLSAGIGFDTEYGLPGFSVAGRIYPHELVYVGAGLAPLIWYASQREDIGIGVAHGPQLLGGLDIPVGPLVLDASIGAGIAPAVGQMRPAISGAVGIGMRFL